MKTLWFQIFLLYYTKFQEVSLNPESILGSLLGAFSSPEEKNQSRSNTLSCEFSSWQKDDFEQMNLSTITEKPEGHLEVI